MLVQDEWGWLSAFADRRDCLDDLSRFREVVGDRDSLAAVTFAVNDLPTRWNSASGRLPDCQGTEANEKIVRLIAFVPGGKEDREKVAMTLRSPGQTTYPRRRRLAPSVGRGL